jgi:energy-coupling factor transport system ATP-binding protein
MTVVIVEQKIMLLCEFAKNLAVMSQGKLIIHGSIRNVLEKSEKLEQLGINCPRMVTLSNKLKENGFISEVCITVDEAEKMARRLICD